MSKNLFTFLLSELNIVRVVCKAKPDGKDCGHVIEMPLARLGKIVKCPACGEDLLDRHKADNRLAELRQAVEHVRDLENYFDVEFVLPVKDPLHK